ncbi:hypothetical protein GCM10028813_30320 [Ramlibacter alkalitolerans]
MRSREPAAEGSSVRVILQKGFPRGEFYTRRGAGLQAPRDKFTKSAVGISLHTAPRGAGPEPGHGMCNLSH